MGRKGWAVAAGVIRGVEYRPGYSLATVVLDDGRRVAIGAGQGLRDLAAAFGGGLEEAIGRAVEFELDSSNVVTTINPYYGG